MLRFLTLCYVRVENRHYAKLALFTYHTTFSYFSDEWRLVMKYVPVLVNLTTVTACTTVSGNFGSSLLSLTAVKIESVVGCDALMLFICCRHVPYRVRVRLARKRNEDEDSPNKLYTLVTHVPVTTFKGQHLLYTF